MRFPAAILAASILAACLDGESPAKAPTGTESYPTGTAGLASAAGSATVDLADGADLILDAAPVKKILRGREVRMLAYNGSIPGPLIRVKQGSRVAIRLKNHTGFPTTLHAHGIRMDNRYDGAANYSQAPVAQGDSFTYHLKFPDAGMFWYHAHQREDWSKEMGLYGNLLVVPADTAYWRPVDREQVLMLDDFWLDTAKGTAPFRTEEIDRTMMGRFGNLYLINGDTAFEMTVKRNEVVRFYATNAANTRTFNVGFANAALEPRNLKIVGSDNGQYEYFDMAANALVAPGERKIFEAWFDEPGLVYLIHHMLKSPYNNDSTVILGRITVLADSVPDSRGGRFLAEDSSLPALRGMDSLRAWFNPAAAPDKILLMTGRMGAMPGMPGMKASAAQGEPIGTEAKGIEWRDHMAEMNAASTTRNMEWIIRDVATGMENHAIQWSFRAGDKVRIRIRNDSASAHPMPHPIHFHGQRFLIVAVNGIPNLNKAWKDTYLVGTRETVDILLDAANPGTWMAHCHIAEHSEDMMMFHFDVE
jgi:FtsP/CotA-like multicopper oxidase with cupredoxin domain